MGQPPERSKDSNSDPPAPELEADIRTFLIADVRGYTLFTLERGDEAAAKLAAKFAAVVQEIVDQRGGTVLELRGDEALVVFRSARQALRAAVELQRKFLDETAADPSLPLGVGMGLDAGEAVRVGEGYRGGALNLAARLCGQAVPGEVLASQEVVHLARRVEGLRYVERGPMHLKGLPRPIRPVAVSAEGEDLTKAFAQLAEARTPGRPVDGGRGPLARHRRTLAVGSLIVAVALAVAAVVLLLPSGTTSKAPTGSHPALVAAGARLATYATTGDETTGFMSPNGVGPAVLDRFLWVASPADLRLTWIDPTNSRILGSTPLDAVPSAIAAGDAGDGQDSIWVASEIGGSVTRLNPQTAKVIATIPVGFGIGALAVGEGGVWVANFDDNSLSRIDPTTNRLAATYRIRARRIVSRAIRSGSTIELSLRGVAVGNGAVWASMSFIGHQPLIGGTGVETGILAKVDPRTGKELLDRVLFEVTASGGSIGPTPMVVDGDQVWVSSSFNNTLYLIDESTGDVQKTIPVGESPSFVAVDGQGSVWVACTGNQSLWRVDESSADVNRTITLSGRPFGLSVGEGRVWVVVQ
jgi:YVTN family beta-propeller protein